MTIIVFLILILFLQQSYKKDNFKNVLRVLREVANNMWLYFFVIKITDEQCSKNVFPDHIVPIRFKYNKYLFL